MSFLRPSATLHGSVDLLTSAVQVTPFSKHVLVYYVPGNPGYIEYYRNFLSYLRSELNNANAALAPQHHVQYHIHGADLPGFGSQCYSSSSTKPYSLDDIKNKLIQQINFKAREVQTTHGVKTSDLEIILIGHSIGTWLIIESIAASLKPSHDSQGPSESNSCLVVNARISAAMLLFPTVSELSKSPNGVRGGWLLQSQYAALLLSIMAKLLVFFIPLFVLTAILQIILRMPRHGAQVTASFLKSKTDVRQALHMARDELRQVDKDTWSDEIWGVQKQISAKKSKHDAISPCSTKLFFYWGANDHWVANTTRDTMIAKRARTARPGDENKPMMVIDQHTLPHAFSLKEKGAMLVAKQVSDWILDVAQPVM